MTPSQSYAEIATALAKAQGAFTAPTKNKTADIKSDKGAFRYSYADLAACFDACRGPLAANGLAITQSPSMDDQGYVSVTTMLLHTSGQYIFNTLTVRPRDGSPMAIGSAITYLRRYGLCSLIGLAPEDEDDDGHDSQERERKPPPRRDLPPPANKPQLPPNANVPDNRAPAPVAAWLAKKPEGQSLQDYAKALGTTLHELDEAYATNLWGAAKASWEQKCEMLYRAREAIATIYEKTGLKEGVGICADLIAKAGDPLKAVPALEAAAQGKANG